MQDLPDIIYERQCNVVHGLPKLDRTVVVERDVVCTLNETVIN